MSLLNMLSPLQSKSLLHQSSSSSDDMYTDESDCYTERDSFSIPKRVHEEQATMCGIHHYVMDRFCTYHNVPICAYCTDDDHLRCSVTYRGSRLKLSEDFSSTRLPFLTPTANLSGEKLSQTLNSLKENRDIAIRNIRQTMQLLHDALDAREKFLLEELNNLVTTREISLTEMMSDLDMCEVIDARSKLAHEHVYFAVDVGQQLGYISKLGMFYEENISMMKTEVNLSNIISHPDRNSRSIIVQLCSFDQDGRSIQVPLSACHVSIEFQHVELPVIVQNSQNVTSSSFLACEIKIPERFLDAPFLTLNFKIGNRHVSNSPLLFSNQKCIIAGQFSHKWGGIGGENGQLFNPWGICGYKNEIFVVNYGTHSIHVFSETGSFIRKWGSQGKNNGQLRNPWCVSVSNSEVFVTEQSNNRVSVFDLQGNFLRKWGCFGIGQGQFDHPWGVCISNDGLEVYVTQYQSHKIQVFDRNGNFLREWGSKGFGPGQLNFPCAIQVSDTEVFVCDYCNHRINVYDRNGRYLRMIGRGIGDGDGELDYPTTICLQGDEIYIGEFENHRVSVFNLQGKFIRKFLNQGIADGQIDGTYGLTVHNGRLYICDYCSHRVQVFQ